MSEYTKLLYVLNEEQQKYSKKLELTIECPNTFTINFKYKKLNFGLNSFPIDYEIPINLDEYSEKITNQLWGKPLDADLIYYTTLLTLSAQLNYFDIGIIVNKEMEMWLEKKIDRLQMLDSYSEFCKVTDNRKVSVKEYEENIWNQSKILSNAKVVEITDHYIEYKEK